MRTKTTLTIETIQQIRVFHQSPVATNLCPFCRAETVPLPERREPIPCEIVDDDRNRALAARPINLIIRRNNDE